MSVKQWKQVITLTVIAIILILLVLVIILGIKLAQYKDPVIDEAFASENLQSSYQDLYPDLYVDGAFEFKDVQGKVCYLTFDDGPNVQNTTKILDTLKKNNAKATFFVIYREGADAEALYKRIVNEGHTIAVHTASHNYNQIYSSVAAYLADFEKISSHIEKITGVKPEIFRFPGGSINTYNVAVYHEIIAEMLRRGYTYYDWNVSSGDASASWVSVKSITNNVVSGCSRQNQPIVLMHDGTGHGNTADAVPEIIKQLKTQGFSFEGLDKTIKPFCFGY